MKKYIMFFNLRFATGLQYRMSAVTALTTQLIWGIMECLAYKAIAEAWEQSCRWNILRLYRTYG